jgi:cell division protein FtsL
MIRLNTLLAAVLVVCALGLVTSQHRARKLFIEVERAHGQTRQLEVQWDQLQLEQSALATSSLIDAKARKGLSMQPAPPQRTLYLSLDTPTEKTAMGGDR